MSSKTLTVGEPLELRCNFFVLGINDTSIQCVYDVHLMKLDETANKYLRIAKLPINSSETTYLKPWWTVTFGDLNDARCANFETATITASTTAVRIEDSGIYLCLLLVKIMQPSGAIYVGLNITETVTVLPSVMAATTTQKVNAGTDRMPPTTTSTNMCTFLVMAIIVYIWRLVMF
ncbi:uncharacterized protein LOC129923990 isoform X2 [Biomphalaria glabrata]|nr:uncharacterized protein LOC129923990 isoform X2 [Biomphalaria glabrata]